jgi:hypothetical protein
MNQVLAPHTVPQQAPSRRGSAGRTPTAGDLPAPDTGRWVSRREAEVVVGVCAGLISIEEACRRSTLSVEEFLWWQRRFAEHGLRGLRATGRPGAGPRD